MGSQQNNDQSNIKLTKQFVTFSIIMLFVIVLLEILVTKSKNKYIFMIPSVITFIVSFILLYFGVFLLNPSPINVNFFNLFEIPSVIYFLIYSIVGLLVVASDINLFIKLFFTRRRFPRDLFENLI